MRFAFVLPDFDESKNSFSKLLAPVLDRLTADGHTFTLVSANRSYQGRYSARHHAAPFPALKPGFLQYFAFLVWSSVWLLRQRRNFDVIHNLGVGTTLVQDVLTAHACHRAWVQTKWQLGQYASLILNPLHVMVLLVEGWNYGRPIPILAVCERLADEIRRYYPFAAARIHVVPNGVDRPSLLPAHTPPDDHFAVTFASNDHGKKGLGELLTALKKAKAEGRDWRLTILGSSARDADWQARVLTLGLSDRVHFAGHVTNIREHMARSHVFCLPSYYEAFGLVFVEAAQIGMPVIGTDVGIYPSLIGNTFAGLPLSLPLSSDALYAALARVETDQDWQGRLGQTAEENARHYSMASMVQKTVELLMRTARPSH